MEDNAFPIDQLSPFFLERLLQSHELLTVGSRINGLAMYDQFIMNNTSLAPPNTKHCLSWR